ncbi:CHASE2 domain-containing protein [Psychroserpens sp. MEBiC05023]
MAKLKLNLLHRDALLCTIFTFIIASIFYFAFINLSILDPFEKAFKDFQFTDIYYSNQWYNKKSINNILLVNIKQANRYEIAQAIEKAASNNPKVLGLDIVFEDKKNSNIDGFLKSTLKGKSNIVYSYYIKDSTKTYVRNNSFFEIDNKSSGFIHLNLPNQDKTIRDFIGAYNDKDFEVSFATQIALRTNKIDSVSLIEKVTNRIPIKYIGNHDSFSTFDIDAVIASDSIPAFKDAIVLFGYLGPTSNAKYDIQDKHYTPLNSAYVGRSSPDMYGLAIHANILNMLINDSYLKVTPKFTLYLLAFVLCFFVTYLGMKLKLRNDLVFDIVQKSIQLLITVLLLYIALLLLRNNIYTNTTPILILSVLGLEMIGYYTHLMAYLNKKYKWKSPLLNS